MDQFCLRWENHQKTFMSVLHSLLTNERLVDVTISADGQNIGAHKVVLTACSGYFEKLFSECGDKHPVVFLKDVKFEELKCLLHYMYFGEVNVAQDQLPQLIKTAESLKIKGLSDGGEEKSVKSSEAIYGLPNTLESHSPQLSELTSRSLGSPFLNNKRKRFKAARPLEIESLSDPPSASSPSVFGRAPNTTNNDLLKNIGDDSLQISPISIIPTSQPAPPAPISIPSSTPPIDEGDDDSIKSDIKIKTEKQEVFEEIDQCLDEGPSHFSMDDVSEKDDSNANWPNVFEDSQDPMQFNASQENSSGGAFKCGKCCREYKQKRNLVRHIRYECTTQKMFACPVCSNSFSYRFTRDSHYRRVHMGLGKGIGLLDSNC